MGEIHVCECMSLDRVIDAPAHDERLPVTAGTGRA